MCSSGNTHAQMAPKFSKQIPPPVMRRRSRHNARDEADDVIMTCFDDDSRVQSSGERLGKDILRLCRNSFSKTPEKKYCRDFLDQRIALKRFLLFGISGGSALLSVAAATSGGNSGASSPSVSSSKKFFLSTDRLKAFAADAAHKLKKESSISETQSELPKKVE